MAANIDELVIQKFKEDFQKIVIQHSEFWTSNDVRAIERALQELGHVERKLKSINERKKVSV